MVLALLRHWGREGFAKHIHAIRALYRSRRDALLSAAEKHLTGLATWEVPQAGMFVWFDLTPAGVVDSTPLIKEKAVNHKVLLVPGGAFACEPGARSPMVRAAYSVATPAQMDEAMKRLAALLRAEAKL
jgi:kynurenine/2-aminoadipate aminotransferase